MERKAMEPRNFRNLRLITTDTVQKNQTLRRSSHRIQNRKLTWISVKPVHKKGGREGRENKARGSRSPLKSHER
jgi:hypothetical protein